MGIMIPRIMTTIDQKIAELITNNLNINDWPLGNLVLCTIALVLSILLCGAIGFERERRGRSAGLRTHLLVGVGSCIIMIISIYGFPQIFATEGKRDVARLAAQVVTGVGFLGAGAIMTRANGGIRGLTTAATIWIVMAIGIACGSFNFVLAIAGTVLILVVLTLFKKVEVKLSRHNPTIVLTTSATDPVLGIILSVSKRYNCTIHGVSTEMIGSGADAEVQVVFQAAFNEGDARVMEYLSDLEKETKAKSIQLLSHQ